MSAAWAAVLAVGVGTVALKGVGPAGLGARPLPRRIAALLGMVAPALLAALVVVEAFAHGRALVLDARVAGLAAGGVAVAVRAPLWAIVVAGAAATALVRAFS